MRSKNKCFGTIEYGIKSPICTRCEWYKTCGETYMEKARHGLLVTKKKFRIFFPEGH